MEPTLARRSPCCALLLAALLCGCADAGRSAAPTPSAADAAPVLRRAEWAGVAPLSVLGGVYLAGQPSEADLQHARAAGVATVVDLRGAGEDRGYDEAATARDLGLSYVSVPVSGADDLTDEAFGLVREVLRGAGEGQGVLLHCRTSNRTGPFWIAHRVLDQGVAFEQAEAEARAAGLKSDAFVQRARAYVDAQRSGG